MVLRLYICRRRCNPGRWWPHRQCSSARSPGQQNRRPFRSPGHIRQSGFRTPHIGYRFLLGKSIRKRYIFFHGRLSNITPDDMDFYAVAGLFHHFGQAFPFAFEPVFGCVWKQHFGWIKAITDAMPDIESFLASIRIGFWKHFEHFQPASQPSHLMNLDKEKFKPIGRWLRISKFFIPFFWKFWRFCNAPRSENILSDSMHFFVLICSPRA